MTMLRRFASLAVHSLLAVACTAVGTQSGPAADPRRVVDELLAADRQFSAAAARTDAISAISPMLADDVWMPIGGRFARERAAVKEALRGLFGAPDIRAEWTPIRGGISADGGQGFTFGYMTVVKWDGSRTPLKYLSYWVKQPAGWRVVAYKLTRRATGNMPVALMEPALPAHSVAPSSDRATMAAHLESLIAAERAFSDRAQQIGLGLAFEENGSADAVNMGGPDSPSFIVGSRAIGRAVSGGATGPPSPVSWAADRAIVASSGDLGVTFGMIRPNTPPPDTARPASIPFFTIWRRTRPTDPWRYIAE
ncbi:MAG: hypothetical protein ABR499_07110 [Gemmatimonadaceae bacterium]